MLLSFPLVCQSSHGQTFYDMLTQKAAKDLAVEKINNIFVPENI